MVVVCALWDWRLRWQLSDRDEEQISDEWGRAGKFGDLFCFDFVLFLERAMVAFCVMGNDELHYVVY